MHPLSERSRAATAGTPGPERINATRRSRGFEQFSAGASRCGDALRQSGRLHQALIDHDVQGEKSIAIAQAGICLFVLVLHLMSQYSSGWQSSNVWVPSILIALIATSALRYMLARISPLPEVGLELLNLVDVSLFLSLIWSYQFAYDHPAGGILRAPSMSLLFVIIALRALRFHPLPIAIAGITAVVGWGLMTWFALLEDGYDAITHSYTEYLTSYRILIGAEVEKMVALSAFTLFLALAAYSARKIFSQAADASDFAEALEAAECNLAAAEKARKKAETVLKALEVKETELLEQNARFNAALDNMPQGLCMFDADRNLIVCNGRYINMYGLPPELGNPGTPFWKILEYRIASGINPGDDPDDYVREGLSAFEEGVSSTKTQKMPDGRVITISYKPMSLGGWVATHQVVPKSG
jgi:PAS domain-containing protein